MHHSWIRISCSKLNYDLCYKLHVINEPYCICGVIGDPFHYFLECPNFVDPCIDLFNAISAYSYVDLEVILQGSPNLNEDQNKAIFDAVHLYLERTRHFHSKCCIVILPSPSRQTPPPQSKIYKKPLYSCKLWLIVQ